MTDQLTTARDQIAEMCGIVLIRKSHTESQPRHPRTWVIPDVRAWCEPDHPIPACLNFVSLVWPDEWGYEISKSNSWSVPGVDGSETKTVMTQTVVHKYHDAGDGMVLIDDPRPTELESRMSGLFLLLKHLQSNDRPAFDAACEKIRKEIG